MEYSGHSIEAILDFLPEKLCKIVSGNRRTAHKIKDKSNEKPKDSNTLKIVKYKYDSDGNPEITTTERVIEFRRFTQYVGKRKHNRGKREDLRADTITQFVDVLDVYSRLKENQREILRLYYWEGYGQQEIAELLHYDQSNVSKTIKRTCTRMAEWINGTKKKPPVQQITSMKMIADEIEKPTRNDSRARRAGWKNFSEKMS